MRRMATCPIRLNPSASNPARLPSNVEAGWVAVAAGFAIIATRVQATANSADASAFTASKAAACSTMMSANRGSVPIALA